MIETSRPMGRADDISKDDLIDQYNALVDRLEEEQLNSEQLRSVLKDYQTNLDRALLAQANLEEDIFQRNQRLNILQAQVVQGKQEKMQIEDRLENEVADYTKKNQEWTSREQELSQQKRALEQQLRTQRLETQIIREENSRLSSYLKMGEYNDRSLSLSIDRRRKPNVELPAATPKHLQGHTKDETSLVANQTEIAVRECNRRIEQYRREMAELQAMNARLVEENQEFQLLLAEKTVMGSFSVDGEHVGRNNTLANELEALEQNSETESDDPHSIISTSDSEKAVMNPKFTNKSSSSQEQFQLDSLQNQNHALRLSLERLVGRLLDYREFEQGIENRGNVHQRSISEFYERVTRNPTLDIPKSRPFVPLPSVHKPSSIYQHRPRAGLAIRPMIFNNGSSIEKMDYSDARVPSYGIDDATPSPRSSASELSELSAVSPSTIRSTTGSFSQDSILSPRPSISSQQGLKPLELETGEEVRKSSWQI